MGRHRSAGQLHLSRALRDRAQCGFPRGPGFSRSSRARSSTRQAGGVPGGGWPPGAAREPCIVLHHRRRHPGRRWPVAAQSIAKKHVRGRSDMNSEDYEVLRRDIAEAMWELIPPLEDEIEEKDWIPKDVLVPALRKVRAFGLLIAPEFGGAGLTVSQY